MSTLNDVQLKKALGLLGELLEMRTQNHIALVVCGGSALIALKLVSRATKDIDIVARLIDLRLVPARPLPEALTEAARLVSLEMGLTEDWLNAGPAEMLNDGLPNQGFPEGFKERLVRRDFGRVLSTYLVDRFDQIHFKLFAAADQPGPGRHLADLMDLAPTDDELVAAARWARLHDPSEGFVESLRFLLKAMEKEHVSERI